ncbi:hypothetical protein C8F01DRAFT_1000635 [Mycena amicta]|nr:hypothetical protein C8F01DRAFT_1000635 [Mycena amicta]
MLNTVEQERVPVALGKLPPRPIPNSYFATSRLLATEYPWHPLDGECSAKVSALLAAGVRTFCDLTEHGELSPYASWLPSHARRLCIDEKEIEYHRVPIRDR